MWFKSTFFMRPSIVCMFRYCLLALFSLLVGTAAQARTFYFSSTSGNDSYSSTQAQDQSTPWQTLSKLNSFGGSLISGDSVLFKTDDTFYGTILPKVSGITFGSYGVGEKPVITGLTTVSSWTSLGNNIWEAPVPGGLSTLNVVVVNGALTPMGRYPNANTANSGYSTYESFITNVSLTDNQLQNAPNWTGGEVVVRRVDYTTDRAKIISHSGNTITFSTYAGVDMHAGYGYFVQNHVSTLDQNGEWYYDPRTKKIKIYYTSRPPSIQVSTLTNLVNMLYPGTSGRSNITIRDISFKGSEGDIMQLTYCNNITIDNCDLAYGGINGIEYRYVSYLTIKNSSIIDMNMMGIFEYASAANYNITIFNNTFRRIGINAGMINNSYPEGVSSTGINVLSKNLLIQQNVLDSIGYIGISIKGNADNQIIRKNVVSNYCSVKNDGGAIYNAGFRGNPVTAGAIIDSNIVFNAIGAIGGTTSKYNKHTRAIYCDATSDGVKILDNTIFDGWDGIYLSQSQNVIIKGNTVYNTGNYNPPLNIYSASLILNDAFDGFQHLRKNTITNNIFFAKNPYQLLYYQTDRYNGVDSIGTVDNNYFVNPTNDYPLLLTNTGANSLLNAFSFKMWQSSYQYEAHSKNSNFKVPQFTYTLKGTNKSPNELFNSNISGTSASSSPTVHTISWDNSGKISGAGSIKLTSSVAGRNLTSLIQDIGAVIQGKKYVLKFKTRATKLGSYQASVRQDFIVSAIVRGSVDTAFQQHEFYFSWDTTSQADASLYINFSQDNSTIYIDDIQFYEASVIPVDIDDYHRFDYNATNFPVTIPLSSSFRTVDGTLYNHGSISLPPFTSRILLKDTAAIVSNPVPAGDNPTAVAIAGAINCSGTTYPITVSGTGGTAPYRGTGIFNTNAGKGSLKISFPQNISNVSSILFASVGAITAGKIYILRFSTLGTTGNGQLNVLLRKTDLPSNLLAAPQAASFGTSRIDHQFTFKPTVSDTDGSFHIEIQQSSGTTYIDNVAFFEASSSGNLISSNLFSPGQFETDVDDVNIWSSNNNEDVEWDGTGKINNTNYYTITDAAGLKASIGIVIKQPATPLSAKANAANITVNGGTTTLTVTATGGAAPYKGTGISTVGAGKYNITVSDANGCSTTATITITEPQPNGSGGSGFTALAASAPVNCSGITVPVTVSAIGGKAPYTGTGIFNTNAGKGSLKISFPQIISTASTVVYAPVGPITAGKTYILKFTTLGTTPNGQLNVLLRKTAAPANSLVNSQTDNFGMSRDDHQFIFKPTISDINGSCHIEINQNSGTTYIDNIALFEADTDSSLISDNMFPSGQFENGIDNVNIWSANNNEVTEWDTTSKINNTDYYTVTDSDGDQSTVGINILQPLVPLTASIKLTDLTTVFIGASGGAAPYTGVGNFTVGAGINTFTVTDANGCSYDVSINIPPKSTPAVVISQGAISCTGSTHPVTVSATGGTAPYTGIGVFYTNAGKGSLKISFPVNNSSNNTVIFSSVGAITAGKTYVLRFTTLGTTGNGRVNAVLRQFGDDFDRLDDIQTATFGNSRVEHEFLFTPAISNTNGRVDIEIAQNSGTTYIDNIAFFEATSAGKLISSNIIGNGQFEADIDDVSIWSLNDNQVAQWDNTGKISNINYYTVTDANGAQSTTGILITQPATPLKTTVTLTGPATVAVSATGGAFPYTGTGNFPGITGINNFLVTDANGCTSVGTINISQSAARSSIAALGNINAPTSLDFVNTSGELKISCYPNPTTTSFRLLIEGGSNEKVAVTVMGADGRTVFQAGGDANAIYKFGNDLASGLYFIKVIQGKTIRTLKVIKNSQP